MNDKDDKNSKHYDLCQLYEKMDENEREVLIQAAGKLADVQSSMGSDKAGLRKETDKAELA